MISVPRSEIEKDNEALQERIDGVEKRLDTMDKRIKCELVSASDAFGTMVLTIRPPAALIGSINIVHTSWAP